LDYKGLDLTIFGQGQSGNDIMMGFIRKDFPTTNRLDLFFTDRWTPANTNATRPRANVDPKYWNSSAMLFNGDFFRIKQIQLGYSLPNSLLNKTFVSKVRLFVSLEDYFIFTKYPGFDPEASNPESSQNGIDLGYYPTSTKTMFGLSVAF
jgi:TonB-dependent starch-binding outer membrane protein SusC